ncbi:hypothetical protein AB0F83_18420 [Micromonospora chalcea]|uniref:hypothetical protein n=1 Tax=Micromonospora chalcea TaxID=1874 RepID=UPI0033C5707B
MASLWLNAGVPPTEVARRLGHGVAVLLRVYANCIDGVDDTMNDKIGDALGRFNALWSIARPATLGENA